MYTYPRPQNLPYPARVLSSEGRFMRRSEVGQSESWPEGQPEGRCGAPADVPRKHGLGRPWVSVRAHYGALPLAWLDGDRQRREMPSRSIRPLAMAMDVLARALKSPGERVRFVPGPVMRSRRASAPGPLMTASQALGGERDLRDDVPKLRGLGTGV
jgi:hypothetical protein